LGSPSIHAPDFFGELGVTLGLFVAFAREPDHPIERSVRADDDLSHVGSPSVVSFWRPRFLQIP